MRTSISIGEQDTTEQNRTRHDRTGQHITGWEGNLELHELHGRDGARRGEAKRGDVMFFCILAFWHFGFCISRLLEIEGRRLEIEGWRLIYDDTT